MRVRNPLLAHVPSKIYIRPAEVASRLHDLQAPAQALQNAVQRGVAAGDACTDNDPVLLPGVTGWGKTVGFLRDGLDRWTKATDNGYETTVRADLKMAIAVAGGNGATGRPGVPPSTRTPKGAMTIQAIEANNGQQRVLEMFELERSFPPPPAISDTQTWILLFYIDRTRDKEEIRLELSLPVGMDANRQVTAWEDRIILPPLPYMSPAIPVHTPDHIVVDVTYKDSVN
jgi:hypothetical protein